MNTSYIKNLNITALSKSLSMILGYKCNLRRSIVLTSKHYCITHQTQSQEHDDKTKSMDDSSESVSESKKPISSDPMVLKFNKMLEDMDSYHTENEDIVNITNFGHVRFDSDNIPTLQLNENSYGKVAVESSEDQISENIEADNLELIDSLYFNQLHSNSSSLNTTSSISEKNLEDNVIQSKSGNLDDLHYLDEQYIKLADVEKSDENGDTINTNINLEQSFKQTIEQEKSNLNVIDDLYFNSDLNSNSDLIEQSEKLTIKENITVQPYTYFSFDDSVLEESQNELDSSVMVSDNKYEQSIDKETLSNKMEKLFETASKLQNDNVEKLSVSDSEEKFSRENLESEDEDSQVEKLSQRSPKAEVKSVDESEISKITSESSPFKNALEFVLEKRKQESNQKSNDTEKYKRIIKTVPNFSQFLEIDVLNMLKAQIVYDNHDIIGLNKPYGIPIHKGGEPSKYQNHPFILTDLLPLLANHLKIKALYPVHRLDINTTGVILVAKTEEMAQKLKYLFKERKIRKTYLSICKHIPTPSIGVINIPIAEGSIGNVKRMVLRPDIPGYRSKSSKSKQAITKYKVISSANQCSFVELNPSTGVKHQIRVHLGFGLGCPIIADHKYSHIQKLVPQKLSGDILQHLDLKQSRVRDLPMFLHARSISIPEVLPMNDITIKAHLPKHFQLALKYLELTKRFNQINTSRFQDDVIEGKIEIV